MGISKVGRSLDRLNGTSNGCLENYYGKLSRVSRSLDRSDRLSNRGLYDYFDSSFAQVCDLVLASLVGTVPWGPFTLTSAPIFFMNS